MNRISLEEAQARLPELIDKLLPGEELSIDRDGIGIAKIVACARSNGETRPEKSASLRRLLAEMKQKRIQLPEHELSTTELLRQGRER